MKPHQGLRNHSNLHHVMPETSRSSLKVVPTSDFRGVVASRRPIKHGRTAPFPGRKEQLLIIVHLCSTDVPRRIGGLILSTSHTNLSHKAVGWMHLWQTVSKCMPRHSNGCAPLSNMRRGCERQAMGRTDGMTIESPSEPLRHRHWSCRASVQRQQC